MTTGEIILALQAQINDLTKICDAQTKLMGQMLSRLESLEAQPTMSKYFRAPEEVAYPALGARPGTAADTPPYYPGMWTISATQTDGSTTFGAGF